MKLNKNQRRNFILPALLVLALLGNLIGSSSQAAMRTPGTAATMAGGTVVGWGRNNSGQVTIPADLSDVTAIAAGSYHSLALKSGGTVVGWGSNSSGQLNIPAGLSGVTAIAAGVAHSLALKSDGTVVGWGYNGHGQVNIPVGLSGVTAIAAGYINSLALKSDGTVVGWGYNYYGELNIPAEIQGSVTAIAIGGQHNLLLKSDGTVVALGDSGFGALNIPADLNGVTAIDAGGFHNLALKSDGTVVGWGDNSNGQVNIPVGLSGVTAIAAGNNHSMALKSDGTVVAWGNNNSGQLNVPAGLSGVTAIAAGLEYSLALKSSPPPNTAPVALSKNVTIPAGSGCTASVTAAQVNNGSYDPDAGDSITLSLDSTGPFGLGNHTVTLTVTDSNGAASSANATVTVTNQPPVLGDYPSATVVAGGAITVTPASPPSDNFSISSVTVTAAGFTGTVTVNPTTGAVSIANAGPVGGFIISVKAADNCGAETTKTFTLTVTANTCGIVVNPATLPQPYVAMPYARILSATPNGSYTFSVSAGQLPPGLQLTTVLSVTSIVGLPTTPGTYSFTIKAKKNNSTCEATRSYTLTIPATVAPILNCVMRNANGSYTAKFGYHNSTGAAVTIPVGNNNYFTPGAQNRGQVTVFQPGVVTNAFSVTFNANGSNLGIWFLKGPDGVLRPVNVLTTSIGCASDTAPTVTITGPANGATFQQGQAITFTATATDLQDGNLSAAIVWTATNTSNPSAVTSLGTGASVITSSLAPGSYQVTARVTDSGALAGVAQVGITVTPPCSMTASFTPAGGLKTPQILTIDAGGSSDSCNRPLKYYWQCSSGTGIECSAFLAAANANNNNTPVAFLTIGEFDNFDITLTVCAAGTNQCSQPVTRSYQGAPLGPLFRSPADSRKGDSKPRE